MKLNSSYIFYFEDQFQPELNKFILKNRKKIDKYISKNRNVNLQFVYFPELKNRIDSQKIIYSYPGLTSEQAEELAVQIKEFETPDMAKLILEKVNYKGDIYPGLFRFIHSNNNQNHYKFDPVKGDKPREWRKFLKNYILNQQSVIDELPEEIIREKSYNEYYGKKQINKKVGDIESKFEKIGDAVSMEVLDLIKKIDNPVQISMIQNYLEAKLKGYKNDTKLSRIVINKKEIILPDYHNTIINLTPLQKAVYILFMNHEEGIQLPQLPDYKDEILDIYLKFTERGLLDDISKSIDALTDPLDNSIHEKFSKIKSAFIKKFHDSLASYYYISGAKNEPKKIAIDRNLVEINM